HRAPVRTTTEMRTSLLRPARSAGRSFGPLEIGTRPEVPRRLLVGQLFGWFRLHCIISSRRGIARDQAGHRPNVSHELPYLIFRHAAAKRRHSVWTPPRDAREHGLGLRAVDPVGIHQGGPVGASAL